MNSERLHYEKIKTEDFDDYLKLVSHPEVMKMITGVPLSKEKASKRMQEMLKNNEASQYGAHFKICENGKFLGHCKLEMTGKNEAEIGYLMFPEYWGRGFGSEIAQTLVKQAKNISEIETLIAIIDPENMASRKILEKCGFQWDYDGEYTGMPAVYFKMELR